MNATPEQRKAFGKQRRADRPRSAMDTWTPVHSGRDVVATLTAGTEDSLQWLLPIRWARMAESPFAFYRGTAGIMAADLAEQPDSGLEVQLCGDAHVANFGAFATAERNLVFDLNDFDETLPGPFEWDVKRLAASVVLAAREAQLDPDAAAAAAGRAVESYRKHMAEYAAMGVLDIWYSRVDATEALEAMSTLSDKRRKEVVKRARKRTSAQLMPKLTELEGDRHTIKAAPPLVLPIRDEGLRESVFVVLRSYLDGAPPEVRDVLRNFTLADVALKVVGVGSVGTRCLIALGFGRDYDDPFFLQVKEAGPSVLEQYLRPSEYSHHGQRVVVGQRCIQAAGDPFLGWASGTERSFYVRQLRDMKFSAQLTNVTPDGLGDYAALCGRVLSRAHARTGDPIALHGYMGKSKEFDDAIVRGAIEYADRAVADHAAFCAAIDSGRLVAAESAD